MRKVHPHSNSLQIWRRYTITLAKEFAIETSKSCGMVLYNYADEEINAYTIILIENATTTGAETDEVGEEERNVEDASAPRNVSR